MDKDLYTRILGALQTWEKDLQVSGLQRCTEEDICDDVNLALTQFLNNKRPKLVGGMHA